MLALLEVAVRVWCRVAAGVEVVVEVFFEACELGWISWISLSGNEHLGFAVLMLCRRCDKGVGDHVRLVGV